MEPIIQTLIMVASVLGLCVALASGICAVKELPNIFFYRGTSMRSPILFWIAACVFGGASLAAMGAALGDWDVVDTLWNAGGLAVVGIMSGAFWVWLYWLLEVR